MAVCVPVMKQQPDRMRFVGQSLVASAEQNEAGIIFQQIHQFILFYSLRIKDEYDAAFLKVSRRLKKLMKNLYREQKLIFRKEFGC